MEASGPPGSGATSLELTVKPVRQNRAKQTRSGGGGVGVDVALGEKDSQNQRPWAFSADPW